MDWEKREDMDNLSSKQNMDKKETLFDLVRGSRMVTELIIGSGGEITPEIESLLTITDEQLPAKVDNYCSLIERLEHEEKYFKTKREQYKKIEDGFSKARERIKERVKSLIVESGLQRLEGNNSVLSIKRTRGILHCEDVEEAYTRVVIEKTPDKEKIREALESGQEVKGAYIESSYSLTIGVKK